MRIGTLKNAIYLLLCSLTFAIATQSSAAPLLKWTLAIAEDSKVVANPTNMSAQMMAAWRTQQELLAARDTPFFRLTNTTVDEPNAKITKFILKLGSQSSATHNFDAISSLTMSPGVTVAVVTPADGQGELRSNQIELNFTGLTVGKFVQFRADIDCDTGNVNMFCDYRSILSDLSGPFGYNSNPVTGDNATAQVRFSSTVLPFQPPVRRLGTFIAMKPTTTGIGFRSAYSMDSVAPLTIGGQIPEPGSMMMMGLLSLASVFGIGRIRRRQS